MPGMIQAQKAQKPKDPMLRQVVQRIESTLKPEIQRNYHAVVVAGMKLMWGPQFEADRQDVLNAITGPQDVPKVVAHAIAKVVSIVQNESKQTEPFPAAVPAGITLMCHALEFVEAAKKMDVDQHLLSQTTMLVKDGIFGIYKITPELLQQLDQQQKAGAKPAQPGQPPPSSPPNLHVLPGGRAA